jgi:hypothetical protein
VTNVVPIEKPAKTTQNTITVELPADMAALVNKYVALKPE